MKALNLAPVCKFTEASIRNGSSAGTPKWKVPPAFAISCRRNVLHLRGCRHKIENAGYTANRGTPQETGEAAFEAAHFATAPKQTAKYSLRQFRFNALALDGGALEFCHDSVGVF